jgi:hypothetical protein
MNAEEINGSYIKLWVFVPISAGTIVLTLAFVILLSRLSPVSEFKPPGNKSDDGSLV